MEKEPNTQEPSTPAPTTPPTPVDAAGENPSGENQWGQAREPAVSQLIEDLRSQVETQRQDLLRTRAEVENVRRRGERNVESAHKFALERFATDLLPVKDSLELGMAVDADRAKLREGMELTLKLFSSVLERFGIREVNPMNERFNPDLHQAMTVQPSATVPPNTVLMVYQKGHTLNDRLIRPALVLVSAAPPPTPDKSGSEDGAEKA